MHIAEGMVLTGMGIALAHVGVHQDKPLYLVGGAAFALLCFVGTIVVARSDGREKAAAEAGAQRAERLWRPAHYCPDCSSVFCPGGTPWQGALTPEQFKKLVWTEAGTPTDSPRGTRPRTR
ncbi:MrpF/PhaF family protein [Streptomyces sp. NPDC029041]|uniref:MrpF/PhaF family protein n=1 Tax=Streptomyces sp. NPDC029041 TaxID=3155727 RepID=UPI0033E81943